MSTYNPRKLVRAEKAGRNTDDSKVLMVGMVIGIAILLFSLVYPRLTENRWYRDVARLTPFHGVQTMKVEMSEDGQEISIHGVLVKRRCEFKHLYGYVYDVSNIRHRVKVDFSAELQGNRPPSPQNNSERWGPWVINLDLNKGLTTTMVPARWEIIAEHVNCPTKPYIQRNLFTAGLWKSYDLGTLPMMKD